MWIRGLRDRGECREDRGDRQENERQAVSPLHRLPERSQGGEFRRAAQACAGPGNRRGRARHVAEESAGTGDVPQAQGI